MSIGKTGSVIYMTKQLFWLVGLYTCSGTVTSCCLVLVHSRAIYYNWTIHTNFKQLMAVLFLCNPLQLHIGVIEQESSTCFAQLRQLTFKPSSGVWLNLAKKWLINSNPLELLNIGVDAFKNLHSTFRESVYISERTYH